MYAGKNRSGGWQNQVPCHLVDLAKGNFSTKPKTILVTVQNQLENHMLLKLAQTYYRLSKLYFYSNRPSDQNVLLQNI